MSRGLIPFIEVPDEERKNLPDELMKPVDGDEIDRAKEEIMEWTGKMDRTRFKWEFSQDTMDTVTKGSEELITLGIERGRKSRNYTYLMVPELPKYLIKMACILAGSAEREEVASQDVQHALVDLKELWLLQLNFIEKKVKGNMDYSNGIPSKWRTGLEFLFRQKAFTKDSSQVRINDYTKHIATLSGKSLSNAQKTYYKQIRLGLVESEQVDRHCTRVWITKVGSDFVV